jgi:DNA-binding MarR family transcriptional regulator
MKIQDAVMELVLETFRLNGRLLATGDALMADLGLSSARWQVLGAIALSPVPLSVAHIARNMGLTRQSVQRVTDEMERDSLVRFAPNPHHQRAKLVLFTPKGKTAFEAAMERQGPWASDLARGLSTEQIRNAAITLRSVRQRLEKSNGGR